MKDHTAPRSSNLTDEHRSDFFLLGLQVMITLLGAVLLGTGLLA